MLASLAAVLLATSSCGLLGGSSADAGANDKVEKSTIRVGELKLTDALPLNIAISELAMTDQLAGLGVTADQVKFTSVPITDMPTLAARGDVDAAVISEPAKTQGSKQNGLITLLDPFSGPTADFPWSGWVATKQFTAANPKTTTAFRRAFSHGVTDAIADRGLVEQAAVGHIGIDAQTAGLMVLPNYPLTDDPVRLQRVADLLAKYG